MWALTVTPSLGVHFTRCDGALQTMIKPGGGTHIGRWNKDVLPSRPPFFRPHFSFECPPLPAPETLLPFFQLPILTKLLASETQNFSKILFWRPQFQAKNISSGDPIFENPGGTYLSKILLTTSPE